MKDQALAHLDRFVLSVLTSEGPRTTKEIARHVGGQTVPIRRSLQRMRRQGIVDYLEPVLGGRGYLWFSVDEKVRP